MSLYKQATAMATRLQHNFNFS